MATTVKLTSVKCDCDNCPVDRRCVRGGLDRFDRKRLKALIRTRSLLAGEALFEPGDEVLCPDPYFVM